ncbi:MAG: MerR family transcriptional regulator [Dehalococcoidales bacterium]|jgi:predicted site-specific integrase-resolvase|nr:MerR family transcriptional regulator [Dehalococcoidales bacterium]
MPVTINGQTYYRTVEVCRTVGISRATLFRWLKQGILSKSECRDRRGWRLFTRDEIDRLNKEVNQINRTGGLQNCTKGLLKLRRR